MNGKFIVIDGTDGSGKGTQTRLVIKKLKEEGKKIMYLDFPQYEEFFGKMVGEYLDGKYGDIKKIHPKMASLLYACDRWTLANKIKSALNKGDIVISNRYTSSNKAHQGCKLNTDEEKEEFLEWIDELEYNKLSIPKPDKVIILKVPSNISQKLVAKKEARNYTNKVLDGHESDEKHLSDAGQLYINLAKKNPTWDVIECVKNNKLLCVEEINEILLRKINEII